MTTTTSSSGSGGDKNYTNKADLTRLANIKHNCDIRLEMNTKNVNNVIALYMVN